jgi:hypothetical protein
MPGDNIIRGKVNSYRIFPVFATVQNLTSHSECHIAILCAIPHIRRRVSVLEAILWCDAATVASAVAATAIVMAPRARGQAPTPGGGIVAVAEFASAHTEQGTGDTLVIAHSS